MRISIQTFFDGQQHEPLGRYIGGVAGIMDELGFAGVWLAEHVVNFRHYDPDFKYPYTADGVPPEMMSTSGMLEPFAALTFMAAHSRRLRLGTGIAILPQRNPVYFAKSGAALDQLSGGRFVAGVGLGWSPQEFAATGTPWEHRGSRMDDYVQVVKTLWTKEDCEFHGRFYDLPRCIHLPKPLQMPHPPLYFGGESLPALRRVARFGQGWFGLQLAPDDLRPRLLALEEELGRHDRLLAEIDVVTSPALGATCDRDLIAHYREIGVAEVVVVCAAADLDSFRRQAEALARELIDHQAES